MIDGAGGPTSPAGALELERELDELMGRRALSAEISLMTLLSRTGEVAAVREGLVAIASRAGPSPTAGRAASVLRLLEENPEGCARVVSIQRLLSTAASTPAEVARLYDACASIDPVASCALYTLGNGDILASATAEAVATLERWGVLAPTARAVDVGCGSGRLLVALASRLRRIDGVDVSPGMVAQARRSVASLANADARTGTGLDLVAWADASLDLVLAVDMWPHVRDLGSAQEHALLREVARVLRPGGSFALFNYSHRGDPAADVADVRALAATVGLDVVVEGARPGTLWDAHVWQLRRPAAASPEQLLAARLLEAEAEVAALRASWSWRVTAPLRAGLDLLRAARGRRRRTTRTRIAL